MLEQRKVTFIEMTQLCPHGGDAWAAILPDSQPSLKQFLGGGQVQPTGSAELREAATLPRFPVALVPAPLTP